MIPKNLTSARVIRVLSVLLCSLLVLSAASCTFQSGSNALATLEKQVTVEWIYTPTLTPTRTPTPSPTITPTMTPTPMGGSGWIAYSRPSRAYGNIVLVNIDGSGVTQLTSSSFDWAPSWSADGKRIVFISERDYHDQPLLIKDRTLQADNAIYIMDANGSSPTRITKTEAYFASPSFSPDGRHILYAVLRNGNFEIVIMNADGTGEKQLAFGQNPAWSPDGSRIVYTAAPPGQKGSQIFVMQADGSGQTQLTDYPGWNETPAWSPDGKRIAFTHINDKNIHTSDVWDIFTINTDGSGQTQVTHPSNPNSGEWCQNPSWSADGNILTYICGDLVSGMGTVHYVSIMDPDWKEMDTRISVYKGNGAVWQP